MRTGWGCHTCGLRRRRRDSRTGVRRRHRQSRNFNVSRKPECDGRVVRVAGQLGVQAVVVGHSERDRFVSRELPRSSILLSGGGEQLVTAFGMRREHSVPVRRNLHVNNPLHVGRTRQWWIERYGSRGYHR